MPRKRMIDPGIWTNEQVTRLTPHQRLLYIGLISQADDEGRLKGNPGFLKLILFPADNLPNEIIRQMLDRLVKENLIIHYKVKDDWYIQHPNWLVWQRVEKPYASKLPPPNGYSPTIPRPFPDHSPPIQGNPKQPNTIQGKKVICPDCKGKGWYNGGVLGDQNCRTCKGTGLVWREDDELLKKARVK